jgi:hypothetical protein
MHATLTLPDTTVITVPIEKHHNDGHVLTLHIDDKGSQEKLLAISEVQVAKKNNPLTLGVYHGRPNGVIWFIGPENYTEYSISN